MAAVSTVWTDPRYEAFIRSEAPNLGWESIALWRAFQQEFGVEAAPNQNAFRGFCRRLKYGGEIIPRASQRVLTDSILRLEESPLLVTSDHHIPAHDEGWLSFAMRLGRAWGCRAHAFNGDVGNFKSVASFDAQVYGMDESLEETLRCMDEVIALSARWFANNYVGLGNHEHWLTRRVLQSKLAPDRLKRFLLGEAVNVHLTEYSFMIANEDRAKGLPGVRITHPKNFSRVPGTVGRQLASKFLQHVIVAHDHLVGTTRDASGQFTVCHSGCMADDRRLDYAQTVDSTTPKMAQGFCIVEGNTIYHFDKANCDQEKWLWLASRGQRGP